MRTSHDTLLICDICFTKSNAFDLTLRKKLFDKCQITEFNQNDCHKVINLV